MLTVIVITFSASTMRCIVRSRSSTELIRREALQQRGFHALGDGPFTARPTIAHNLSVRESLAGSFFKGGWIDV